jgi:1-acyl-sn-glycerol-3-phosphate acyltransferase
LGQPSVSTEPASPDVDIPAVEREEGTRTAAEGTAADSRHFSPSRERGPGARWAGERAGAAAERSASRERTRDRPIHYLVWYRAVRCIMGTLTSVIFGWRATGQSNLPAAGGLLLVSNHTSFVDVFFLGIPLCRPLNYVARSTLFVPVLASLMRSVGGFPIQREGMGASGMKETLRRLRNGGIVTLFPEGTRTRDGNLGPIKPGIAVLVTRAKVPVVPVGLAGTFDVWPRSRLLPTPHPIRIHYGPPIFPDDLTGLNTEAVTGLIRQRLEDCHAEAERALRDDMRC